jgi:hypothetical protein
LAANYRSKIPLSYYNILAENINAKEESGKGSEFKSATSSGFNPDISNPNSHNRGNAFPIIINCSIPRDDQEWE